MPEQAATAGRVGEGALVRPDEARDAGFAHVAAVSFLSARATPLGGFWISLAGGVALARAGERRGRRRGFGASLAAMLQSVAIIGPARLGVPLTQAVTAPILGRMEARGRGTVTQALACAAIRMTQNTLETIFFVGIITGVDAYAGTYGWLADRLALPPGTAAALGFTAAGLLAWSIFGSTVQVLVYRRGLARWRREAAPGALAGGAADGSGPTGAAAGARPAAGTGALGRPRFDPRALVAAAALAFAALLASTSWPVLAVVAAWLVGASAVAARGYRELVPGAVVLTLLLAGGAFAFAAVGDLGLDVALRRGARAGLLVLVATWLRAAAGSDGLRDVARRGLRRLRRVPSLDEASDALDELGATPRLAAAGRSLLRSVRHARKRPLALVDAALDWVRHEAVRFEPAPTAAPVGAGFRSRDAALLVASLAPVAAVVAGA